MLPFASLLLSSSFSQLHLQVRAINSAGAGVASSNYLVRTVAVDAAPAAPQSFSASQISSTSVLISWPEPIITASSTLSGYEVLYKASASGADYVASKSTINTSSDGLASVRLTQLSPNTQYIVAVAAISSANVKSPQGVFTFVTAQQGLSVSLFCFSQRL